MVKDKNNFRVASWLLRIGLAAVFLYAAISSLQHPIEWVGFLPAFLREKISGVTLIRIFAVYEIVLSLWLLSGKYLRNVSLLCAVTLASVLITNPSQLITTFRDIGLVFMALGLFFIEK